MASSSHMMSSQASVDTFFHDEENGENDGSESSASSEDDMSYAESDVDEDGNPLSVASKTTLVSDGNTFKDGGLVKKTKLLIFSFLVLTALVSALVTTFLIRQGEKESFDDHAAGFSQEIESQAVENLDRVFGALQSLGRTITSHATADSGGDDVSNTFPFVTLPRFEVYGGEARKLAKAEVVLYAPLVYASDISDWQTYSLFNQNWIVEGLEHEGDNFTNPGSIPAELHTRNEVPHDHSQDPGEAHQHFVAVPIWQMAGAPRNASIVNLDLMADDSIVEHDVIDVRLRRRPLLSSTRDLLYLTENSFPQEETEEESKMEPEEPALGVEKLNPVSLFELPPQSYVLQPVFDRVEAYDGADEETFESKVVGFVLAVVQWETLFSNILSNGVETMQVVVEDGCDHIFTISIRGENATFLGRGDLHEESYDPYVRTMIDFGGLKAGGFEELTKSHPYINETTYNERYEGTPRGHCEVGSTEECTAVYLPRFSFLTLVTNLFCRRFFGTVHPENLSHSRITISLLVQQDNLSCGGGVDICCCNLIALCVRLHGHWKTTAYH